MWAAGTPTSSRRERAAHDRDGQLRRRDARADQGIDQSAAGARKLDRGAGQLATGSARLADGTARLSTGAQKASAGADKLADGSQQLADGSGQLASGSDKLASGLRTGAEQIPKPSEKRPAVVSDPVEASSDNVSPSSDGVTTLLPAVLAIALWLGAFVTYLVRSALSPERLRMATTGRRVALAGWLPAVGIGLVQAALLFLGAPLSAPRSSHLSGSPP